MCAFFSSLTYSSCRFATAAVGEDITTSLMKRHRRYCELNLLTLCSLPHILFLPILLSHVAKLSSVFPILVEGGLPLNALLERCLDFIIDFHLLFLL